MSLVGATEDGRFRSLTKLRREALSIGEVREGEPRDDRTACRPWTRTSRVIKARPEELYAAFLDPAALVDWMPPAEMRGEIREFEARVGGGYRMSLFYPPDVCSYHTATTEREDMVNVRLVEL